MNVLQHALSIVIFLSVLSSSIAQSHKFIEESELILFGEVASTRSVWNESHKLICTEFNIQAEILYKGSIVTDIITLRFIGGSIGDDFHYSPHGTPNLKVGQKSFFFLNDEMQTELIMGRFEHCFVIESDSGAYLFNKEWLTYNQMSNAISDVVRSAPHLVANLISGKTIDDETSCHAIRDGEVTPEIEFSFEDPLLSSDFSSINFDIAAQVNVPGVRFVGGEIFINYSEEFGTKVIQNSRVDIQKAIILSNTNYKIEVEDYGPQIISVKIIPTILEDDSLYVFGASDQPLLNVTLDISNPDNVGDISFDNLTIEEAFYFTCFGSEYEFETTSIGDAIDYVSVSGVTVGLTYTFENLVPNAGNTMLSFDVFVKGSAPRKLLDAQFTIDFNDEVFGNALSATDQLTYTRGEIISDPNSYIIYDWDFPELDPNASSIDFAVSGQIAQSSNDLSVLGVNPVRLMTITIPIISCNGDIELAFNSVTEDPEINTNGYFLDGAMPIPLIKYNPVIADDTENGSACACEKPVITGLMPIEIPAGTGDILTITGDHFGAFDPDVCTVLFKNGDEDPGDPDMIEAGAKDFEWDNVIHWTNTEIQIRVPSTDKHEGAKDPASTGKIVVRNSCEDSHKSNEKLFIPYALMNYRASGEVMGPREARKLTIVENSSPGLCFHFTNDTPVWIRDQFRAALALWCSETGINFMIGETVDPNTTLQQDDMNIIKYGGQSGAAGGGMAINSVYFRACDTSNERGYTFTEIDFIVYSGFEDQAVQEAKVKQRMTHELGHSHMLAHARGLSVATTPLMYVSGNFITDKDVLGANLVFANSAEIAQSCGIPIGSGLCGQDCLNTGTNDINSEILVSAYPNPTNSSVVLNLADRITGEVEIEIFNVNGVKEGSYISEFLNKDISVKLPDQAGTYFIKVKSQNIVDVIKVSKL